MKIQPIKNLISTHCPLIPLGKGPKSAKNIAPAIQTSPAGAALKGREAVNERRQLGAEAAEPEAWGDVRCSGPGCAIPSTDVPLAGLGIAFSSANRELSLSVLLPPPVQGLHFAV